jgi:hypothetical protein
LRAVLVALLMVAGAAPAQADDWGHYVDSKVGYEIDVPPGLVLRTPDYSIHVFESPTAALSTESHYQRPETFEADQIETNKVGQSDFHWNELDAVVTPTSSKVLMVRGARQVRIHTILLCGKSTSVRYWLEYSVVDAATFAPIIARLDRSFRPTAAC